MRLFYFWVEMPQDRATAVAQTDPALDGLKFPSPLPLRRSMAAGFLILQAREAVKSGPGFGAGPFVVDP